MFRWLGKLDHYIPFRYGVWMFCAFGAVAAGLWAYTFGSGGWIAMIFVLLTLVGLRDKQQAPRSILRNYPITGHIRFMLESFRPEIRQYFLESDTDAAPFSRQQRSLVYQRAKGDPDKRPFGTQQDLTRIGYEWVNHSMAPTELDSSDFRVMIGADRAKPYSASVFNISAMSFGALSANAIQALNTGAKLGNFAHDAGEGGISRYHLMHGGDLVYQVGSGYFGCRDEHGKFNADRFTEVAENDAVRLIEVKLSQGAKPGHGGVLPGEKVTAEIAEARGVHIGEDCLSPASHSAFDSPVGLLQFIDQLRELSGGKPTGFKFCVGNPWEWFAIAKAMIETGITPDFIVVDGAEGGTGAAPLEFSDHVGAPVQEGLLLVHNTLVGLNLRDKVKIGCAGKVVSAFDIARMIAIGADWCNAARGYMFALGCIQAQACHTGHCPTGVATQDKGRQKALVVPHKSERVYQFHQQTLFALKELVEAAGLQHPRELTASHIVRRHSQGSTKLLSNLLTFVEPGSMVNGACDLPVFKKYWPMASTDSFTPVADSAELRAANETINEPVSVSASNDGEAR